MQATTLLPATTHVVPRLQQRVERGALQVVLHQLGVARLQQAHLVLQGRGGGG